MASYPHYRIGDPLPQDKLIIFEDTDNDGKADKQINFADDLHIPIGFEIAHDGVYVSQSGSLVFLQERLTFLGNPNFLRIYNDFHRKHWLSL